MSKKFDILGINTKRRNSSFVNFCSSPDNFRQKLGLVKSNTPVNPAKESMDLLEQESAKIKEFIQKVVTIKDSRRNSNASDMSLNFGVKTKQPQVKKERSSLFLNPISSEFIAKFNLIHNELENKRLHSNEGERKENLSMSVLQQMEEKERGIKRLKKLTDSEGSEDILIDKDDENERWVLFPDSIFINLWEMIVFICLLYIMFIDTYILAFVDEMNGVMIMFSITIDILFVIDFILNFFVAFYDFNEDLITSRKKIILNNLNNGFIIDLLSSIPFSTIYTFFDSNGAANIQYKLIRIARISRLSKLYRALKMTKLIKAFKGSKPFCTIRALDDLSINSNLKRFIRFFAIFLLFNHISTCIWIALSRLDFPNWIFDSGLQDVDNITLYVNGLYFTFTTVFTIGYGDIHAVNVYERLYNILIMIVGVLIYSFAISSLSNIVVKIEKKQKIHNKRLELLHEVRFKYNLDDGLFKLLSRFLTYDLQINKINKKMLINELPQQLQYKIIFQIYKQPIQNLNFFKNASKDFILKAVINLLQIKLFKNEYLIKAGNYLEEMYFIKRGMLKVLLPVNKRKRLQILHLYKNEQFGEIYMCKKTRCPVDVKVLSNICELYRFSKANFIELNEEFPKVIQRHLKKALVNTTKMELLAKDMLFKMNRDLQKESPIPSRHVSFASRPSCFSDYENRRESNGIKPLWSSKSEDDLPESDQYIENQHLQLIDFHTADLNNPAMLTIVEDSHSSRYSQSSGVPGTSTFTNVNITKDNVVTNVNTAQQNSLPSQNAININYHINIQNNVNINKYVNQIIDRAQTLENKKDRKESINMIISTSDKVNPSRHLSSDRVMKPILKKLIRQNNIISEESLPKNETFGRQDSNIPESITESIIGPEHDDSNEMKKVTKLPLFGFFVNKLKQRKSEQPSIKAHSTLTNRLFPRFSFFDEINQDRRDSKTKTSINSNLNLIGNEKRSASIANIKRLSEHHFNDMVENLKKDALLKKNPDQYLFEELQPKQQKTNNIQNREILRTNVAIQDSIDRLTEIFERLLISVAWKG
jgi:hypothetical protein